eukprot:TRINITY_DN67558_c3_g1_i1.p1 TRINITY_DN67558_c3_g1~~TRINITY_DN67558_c3_g1_i1.p1  ORF type:complete len:273 (-),score=36.27 TRINITY_DN67558_c3_g1_i1:159-977(-)
MTRGPKLHIKRLNAPSRLMLSKLGGIYAPRSRAGPHKLRESMPLVIVIRNRLKYALTYREAMLIVKNRQVKVDGVIRTDLKFPVGFMDTVSIEKTKEKFRVTYDSKGRFALTRLTKAGEGATKLGRVTKIHTAPRRVPFIQLHDGRTIRYPDPRVRPGDTVVFDTESKRMKDWIKFKVGVLATVTGGANTGRTGEVLDIEKHPGSFDIVHIKDAADNKFATRASNVFVIGPTPSSPLVNLHKSNGIRLSLSEDRKVKLQKNQKKVRKVRAKK